MSALFTAVMLVGGAGLVLSMIALFQTGAAFQRYKNWQGLWVSYGEALVFVGVACVVVVVAGLSTWIARRREESSFIKKYKKDDGAA